MVFREVEISFGGETYLVTPSNRLLRRIENDVSLSRLAYNYETGNPQNSHLAFVLASLIQTAPNGVTMTEDKAMRDLLALGVDDLRAIWAAVFAAVMPEQPKKKDAEAKEAPLEV